ncbi:MAG: hypothetical protein AAF413_01475 [Patescibacteria group bacterium]
MSDYDFILESNNKPQGSSLRQRLMVVLFGLVILTTLMILVFGVILRPAKGPIDAYRDVYLLQTDISSIGGEYYGRLRDPDTRQFTAGARLLVDSDRNAIWRIISAEGVEITDEELDSAYDSQFRTIMNNAVSTNAVDETFLDIYRQKLTIYRSELAALTQLIDDESEKALVATAIQNIDITLAN